MTALRSLLFNLMFFAGSTVLVLALIPALAAPRRVLIRAGRIWAGAVERLLAVVIGMRVEIRGTVPRGACVVAAKHQSAWETIAFLGMLDDPCYVLKQELTRIPLFGRYLIRSRQIVVDRTGGARALRHMLRQAAAALGEGRQVIVFPQGTRVAPGVEKPYLPGVVALYRRFDVPVVPLALNSGLFWGRRRFVKRRGVIVAEFLEPMTPGLDRRRFLTELERRIESASARLAAEAESAG